MGNEIDVETMIDAIHDGGLSMEIRNCTFDEVSLRNLLTAARDAGIDLSAIDARKLDDGTLLVNLPETIIPEAGCPLKAH